MPNAAASSHRLLHPVSKALLLPKRALVTSLRAHPHPAWFHWLTASAKILFSCVTVLKEHYSTYPICLDRILISGLKEPWKDFWSTSLPWGTGIQSTAIASEIGPFHVELLSRLECQGDPPLCCIIDSLLWWMYDIQNSSLSMMPWTK